MKSVSCTGYYSFHGVDISMSTNHPAVLAALHSRLQPFSTNGRGTPHLDFEFCGVPDRENHLVERPLGPARPVYNPEVGEVVYFDDKDQFYLDYGDCVRVLCDVGKGKVWVSFLESAMESLRIVSHPMFTLPLVELLKRRGLYSLHAAGLCINGRSLLLPGSSASGKSTLAIALLRAGYGFLGDDMAFLGPGASGLRIYAFPDEIDLTRETASFFPELHFLLNLSGTPGCPKLSVRPEGLYQVNFVQECHPAALVFPRVANAETSMLKPMGRDEALLELAPNILLTEAGSCQAHLDALAELTRESECYRLETGRDFEALPMLLRQLVE